MEDPNLLSVKKCKFGLPHFPHDIMPSENPYTPFHNPPLFLAYHSLFRKSSSVRLNHQEIVIDVAEATVEDDGDDDEDIVDDGEDDDGEDDDALQDEQSDLEVGGLLPLLAHWYVLLCNERKK